MIKLVYEVNPENVYDHSNIVFEIKESGLNLSTLLEEMDKFIKAMGYHPQGELGYEEVYESEIID